jgi:hypothetical protein
MSQSNVRFCLLAALLFVQTEIAAADTAATSSIDCRVGEWDMSTEQRLFQSEPVRISAGVDGKAPLPQIAAGSLFELQLAPQKDVVLVAAPSRRLLAEGSFAGIVRFAVPTAGLYRITTDGPFWIDVINGVNALDSNDFGGRQTCPLFRKSVEYALPAHTPLVLQLNGASRAVVRVTVVASARLAPSVATP